MLIPKVNRVAIYEHLFCEGVMVAKKDFHLPKHPEINCPNLHVIKALQSLKSRGYVNEQFAWRHYYWYLTNEGIQYLRDFLHLPPEIVPSTLKRQTRNEPARPRPKSEYAVWNCHPEKGRVFTKNTPVSHLMLETCSILTLGVNTVPADALASKVNTASAGMVLAV